MIVDRNVGCLYSNPFSDTPKSAKLARIAPDMVECVCVGHWMQCTQTPPKSETHTEREEPKETDIWMLLITINGVELIHSPHTRLTIELYSLCFSIYRLQTTPNGRIDVELNIHISFVCRLSLSVHLWPSKHYIQISRVDSENFEVDFGCILVIA